MAVSARAVTWWLAGLVIAAALVLCLLSGSLREAERRASRSSAPEPSIPAYDERIPPFSLPLTSGGVLRSAALQSQWVLFLFSSRSCPAGQLELRALQRSHGRFNSAVLVLPVLTGKAKSGDPMSATRRYARDLGAIGAVGFDPDGRVAHLFGAGAESPTYVLCAPGLRVRLHGTGHRPAPQGSSYLADALLAFFSGWNRPTASLTQWQRFDRLRNAVIEDRTHRIDVADRSMKRLVVLTWLTGDERREMRRIRAVLRYRAAGHADLVFVARDIRAKPAGLRSQGNVTVVVSPSVVSGLNLRYAQGPVSLLLYRGVAIVAEDGPQLSGMPFEHELASAMLLASTRAAIGRSYRTSRQ